MQALTAAMTGPQRAIRTTQHGTPSNDTSAAPHGAGCQAQS